MPTAIVALIFLLFGGILFLKTNFSDVNTEYYLLIIFASVYIISQPKFFLKKIHYNLHGFQALLLFF